MSSAKFQIVYDGPALDGSTIDVRELAPALLALGQALEEANTSFNAGRAKVSLRVNASFKSGCFGIDFAVVQGILDQALTLIKHTPIESAKNLVELLGFAAGPVYGLIKVIMWVKNRQIKEIIELEGGMVRIIIDGDALEVERKTIELLRNYRLRLALEKAIFEPLEKEGFETVSFTDEKNKSFCIIEKSERSYFITPKQDEEVIDERIEVANLQIVSVSFRDDNKWRFTDGSSTFYAAVLDDEFLNRVKLSETSFSAGDILKVSLKKRQTLVGEAMKTDISILEVLNHRKGMSQLRIPFKEL